MAKIPLEYIVVGGSRKASFKKRFGLNRMVRQMLHRLLGASLLVALVSFTQAAEARRIALVIGVGRYTSLKPLANPVSDASAIAAVLRANDFEVFPYTDLTRSDMLDALDAFKSESEQADVALIYYAGHGMENLGKNVIAPADMEFSCEPKQARRTVELDKLFEAIQNVPQQIVLIDACRNDPFPQCARGGGSGVGFRSIEVAARDRSRVLVASSTLSGRLAADGPQGGHSPFATALLARFNSDPRTSLRSLLDDVARDVALGSGGAQTPEVTTRGGAPDVCLAASNCAGSSASGPAAQMPAAPSPAPRSNCNADLDYQDALRKNTAEAYREFLARCPNDRRKETVLGLYTRLADEEMWRNVLKENTLSGYIQYQVAFPTGTYVEQAKQKQGELQSPNKPPALPAASTLPTAPPIPNYARPREITYYQGLDFNGDDISGWMTGYSLNSCAEACRSNPQCKAFTLNTAQQVCILKNGFGRPTIFADATSGAMDGVRPNINLTPATRIDLKPGIDYQGGDYSDRRNVSLDDCQALCANDGRCVAFSYLQSKNWCWLKSSLPAPRRNVEVTSGTKY